MLVFLLTLLLVALVSSKCFEPSPAHPPPEYDPHDPVLQQAFASISTALTIAVAAPEFASTSFSVEVTSSKDSLWSQHHTARERNFSRPDIPQVNGDALYRIASITKTFTVLGILYQHAAGNLSLDNAVDGYLEELGEKSEGGIPWKDITLRSLATQLSGLPREFGQGDFINDGFDPDLLGLPPVSREGLPKCNEYSPDFETPCTADDLFDDLKAKRPLFAPNQQSSYSNLNYELLGLVLERVTNQSYKSYINDAIFTPLNMSTSTLSRPADSAGVIPLNPQSWDVDEGVQNPTGGIYSSTNDLSKYLRYVLTHFNALTHAVNWLHPVSPSRGMQTFYGMPWEIFQTDSILKDTKRIVRFVTKGGSLPGYTSIIMTVPEYDLGITLLVGGSPPFLDKLKEIVTVATIRAAEEVSIHQLNKRYAGTYTASESSLNSTVTLKADHRGLIITTWVSNSTDIFTSPITKAYAPEHFYAQLSPTLLYRDEENQQGEEWRIMITEERGEGLGGVWDDFCIENYEMSSYAGMPFNEIVFWDEQDSGAFDTLQLTGFRVNLTREGKDESGSWYEDQEQMEL